MPANWYFCWSISVRVIGPVQEASADSRPAGLCIRIVVPVSSLLKMAANWDAPQSATCTCRDTYKQKPVQWTVDLQTAPLTDFSSYRLLWPKKLGSTCSRRIDLQTGEKKEQKQPVTGLIGFQCIVSQWSLDLQTFQPAATVPIWINSVSRGSTVKSIVLDDN